MMLTVLAESALRSLILGSVVWIGLNLLRVRNPHVHMTSWVMVAVASLSMPLLMPLDACERHRGRAAVARAGNAGAGRQPADGSVAGISRHLAASDLGTSVAINGANSHRRQLAHGGDRDLRSRCWTAAAAAGGRLLSDLASGAGPQSR